VFGEVELLGAEKPNNNDAPTGRDAVFGKVELLGEEKPTNNDAPTGRDAGQ